MSNPESHQKLFAAVSGDKVNFSYEFADLSASPLTFVNVLANSVHSLQQSSHSARLLLYKLKIAVEPALGNGLILGLHS
jgi:hypothetical protein